MSAFAAAGLLSAVLLSISINGNRLSTRMSGAAQIEDRIRREVAQGIKAEADARAREARKLEEAARATAAGAMAGAIADTSAASLSVEELIYPGADVATRLSSGSRQETVVMTTSDDIESVTEFYTGKLGAPRSSGKAGVTFNHSSGNATISVKVAAQPGARKPLQITIVRTAAGRSR